MLPKAFTEWENENMWIVNQLHTVLHWFGAHAKNQIYNSWLFSRSLQLFKDDLRVLYFLNTFRQQDSSFLYNLPAGP